MKINTVMKKRALILNLAFSVLFSACLTRIVMLQNSEYADVAEMQFSRSLSLCESRGYIYDRNMIPLVNVNKEYKSVYLKNTENEHNIQNNNETEIKNGMLIVAQNENSYAETDYFKNYYTIKRYEDDQLCSHIIGYINSDGKGVCGIEKAFDRILSEASGSLKVNYGADASGKALAGNGINLTDDNYDSPAGISLTIDKNIQAVAEKALKESDIKCGAIVVMDVNTFEITAIASIPVFDPDNIEASLDNKELPFLNRALNAYPAGSVFKPFVAAAAIENGWNVSDRFECQGYIKAGNSVFRCFNSNIHGEEDLNRAIENSCNTFFVSQGIDLGAEKLIEMINKFGFGKKIEFCSTINSVSGNIPEAAEITSDAQLATLCFGQGEILITPVQLAAAYSVLANGGIYKEPVLMKELFDDTGNVYGYYKSDIEYKATDSKVCEIVNAALYNNMLNGTGVNGASEIVTSAGKTATAQTGRYDENGKEILCTWFAGFFPYEAPSYSVIVLNENGSTASLDCAPVFKNVIEGIIEVQGVQ